MRLYLDGHTERYALEQLQMALFPGESMEYTETPFDGDGAVSTLRRKDGVLLARAAICKDGRTVTGEQTLPEAEETVSTRRRTLQQSYYKAAVQLLDVPPPWGALAGVRPTKLTTRCLMHGGTAADCDTLMRDVYYVQPERRRLCIDASLATVEAASLLRPKDLSLYVGIPFCPTRCFYCSFVSQSIEKQAHLLEPFLQSLLVEIETVGQLLAQSGWTVRTVYIGGGTPTTLSAEQLSRLLAAISSHVDLSQCLEYTVEGGRPDTLNREKLDVLRSGGVDRISINPQTMQDAVLQRMGRRHTAADVVAAYGDAVAAGFTAINMDLIAGLPGDSPAGFAESLSRCLALDPSNLTVHTLAIKRSSDLNLDRTGLLPAEAVASMLETAETALRGGGYAPYYLYRQKYMSGSFENVGWSKAGSACLYNIYMMEELHSILSLGGGGVSKVNLPGGKLERLSNPKYPREYLERLNDTLDAHRTFFRMLNETERCI